MGKLPTLGKFGGNFGRKGEMVEEEKMEGRRKKRRKGNREAEARKKRENGEKGKLWRKT